MNHEKDALRLVDDEVSNLLLVFQMAIHSRIATDISSCFLSFLLILFIFQGKDGGGIANENTTNSGSNKHPTQTDNGDDDDDEEDEPVYIESSPCSRWQKRRETVENQVYLSFMIEQKCSIFVLLPVRLLNVTFQALMRPI
jgi:hypothetical protein